MEADITGMANDKKADWEKRTLELAKPEYFFVHIECEERLWRALDETEQQRLKVKIGLVATYAQFMAAGMVKGTVKYPSDDYSLNTWMKSILGEGADKTNYDLLLAHCFDLYVNTLEKQVQQNINKAVEVP